MKKLTQAQQQQVADAITRVEQQTDAELVTVLARRADHYAYLPFLWAAMLAMLLPLVGGLLPVLGWYDWFVWQWAIFVVLALVLRLPLIEMRIVPRRLRHYRAASLARCQFLAQNLHATRDGTGLLIFVSEAERYVEILADRGISQHVPDSEWQELVDAFTAKVKAGDTLQGFLDCIEGCGVKLAQHLPATRQKDELPNHLVIINN
jgi:putative membrane protein